MIGTYKAKTTTRINWLSNPVHVGMGQEIQVTKVNGDSVNIELKDRELGSLSGFQHKSILNKFDRL